MQHVSGVQGELDAQAFLCNGHPRQLLLMLTAVYH